MTRLTLTAFCVVAVLACTTTVEARNFFRLQPLEELAPPPVAAPRVAAPPMAAPYQGTYKTPFQASQKGIYQKGIYHQAPVASNVRYVQHRPCRTCGCGPSYKTTLAVYDPCSRCMIDVPVCLPGCCTGAPQAGGRGGLFGQGITNFSWCCGYKVRVVVSRHGAVTVHYYGA